ncbi:hypothetical protein [Agilicoccus flavus]|uniref:hypothetical protein n=1 Tax=Agilicoccus flavus TaxID=2775968 RepID=UPI001CF67972|nr:hypothetical protein [Agilicoccus flavus]
MLEIITACLWVTTAAGALLALGAAVDRIPDRVSLGLFGVAELGVIVAVAADVALLARGWVTPDLATHIGYLVSLPFIAPAGLALTYKKIDRWGRLILGIAVLIAAIMVVRQIQTLGIPFGYVNLRPANG